MSADQIKGLLIFTGLGIFFMYLAIRKHKLARKVKDTPRSKAASAPQGYIEIQGFAWPVDRVSRLPNGKEVVYHSFKLQRLDKKGSGKNKRSEWVTVYNSADIHPFYLVDGTGLVSVDFNGCEFNLDDNKTRRWGRLSKEEQQSVINKLATQNISGFPPSNFFGGIFAKQFRVVENEIYVGSPLYLHGDFFTENQDQATVKPRGLTDFYKKVFNESSKSQKNLSTILDKNGDGKISHDEAQKGYTFAAELARKKTDLEEREFQIFGVMRSSTEHKLLVADSHEEHLVSRMNKMVGVYFTVGALLITGGVIFGLGPVKSSRSVATVEAMPSVDDLHFACVSGKSSACEDLVNRKSELELSDYYIDYYSKKACELGTKKFCK